MGKFVLFSCSLKVELIDLIENLSEIIPALYPVFELAENFSDFVFDGIRTLGTVLKFLKVREKLMIDKIPKIISGKSDIVVDFSSLIFRHRPVLPAILGVYDSFVLFPR